MNTRKTLLLKDLDPREGGMGEGREGPEFWRRPGLQWILKGIPGQPLLAQPDLSEQVGSRVPVAEREPGT